MSQSPNPSANSGIVLLKRVVSPQGAEWETFDACVESVSEWDGIDDPERVCGAWHQKRAVKERDSGAVGQAVYGPVAAASIPSLESGLIEFARSRERQKARVYVDSPGEVPDEYEVQEGETEGTYYYETDPNRPSTEDAHAETEPNPEQDVERFRQDESVEKAIAATNEDPGMGFTLHRNLEQQELGSEDEWLVGMGGIVLDREIDKEDVLEVYEEFLPLLQAYPGIRIGGYQFEEGGRFSIDVTAAVTDEEEAKELGEALDQESVFNIGTTDLAMTGGDGESPLKDASPEEYGEYLADIESLSAKAMRRFDEVIGMRKEITDAQREMAEEFARDKPDHDRSDVFVADDASDAMSFYQIAMAATKEQDVVVEPAEDGYVIDDVLYQPVPVETDGGEVAAMAGESLHANTDRLEKANRVYIDSRREAPSWINVEQGSRGGLYYELTLESLPRPIRRLIGSMEEEIRQIIIDSLDEARRQIDRGEADAQDYLREASNMAESVVLAEMEVRLESSVEPDVLAEIVELVVDEYMDDVV